MYSTINMNYQFVTILLVARLASIIAAYNLKQNCIIMHLFVIITAADRKCFMQMRQKVIILLQVADLIEYIQISYCRRNNGFIFYTMTVTNQFIKYIKIVYIYIKRML